MSLHAHVHDSEHDHGHAHHATHAHGAARAAPFSLLRVSAFERLAGAAALSALIWAGVWWALH